MKIICVGWGNEETSPSKGARTEAHARRIAAVHLGRRENELHIDRAPRDGRYCWIVTRLPIYTPELIPQHEEEQGTPKAFGR